MIQTRYERELVVAGLLAAVLIIVRLGVWALPGIFEPLRAQAIDRLFELRSSVESLRPPYDETIVLVPIDDRSIEVFESVYLGRAHHAELVRNLDRAELGAQFHDMVFAAPIDEIADRALARATAEAGNVYYGMAVGLSTGGRTPQPVALDDEGMALIERMRWHPVVSGDPSSLREATSYFPTFSQLATAARGMGFLDVVPDRDGVFRRAHLLVRDGDGFLPVLPLLVLADFLDVRADRIELSVGRSITLRDARVPGSAERRDIEIPIDDEGRMVVNFLGPWGSLKSYPFETIDEAAGDRFAMEDLRGTIAGKIGVVAWVATGAGDVGPVPTDPIYPKPGIHANVMNTILTESFLYEYSGWQMFFWIELPLLVLLLVAGIRLSSIPFVSTCVALTVGYGATAAGAFLLGNRILDLPTPVLFLVGSAVVLAAYQFHLESRARARLDRELAVAQEIQMASLPSKMPEIPGYDLAGHSRPADETGGDTFDIIPEDGRVVVLLGDATGHGLGPALSVTQVRSMLRIALRLGAGLDAAFTHINDQLVQDTADNKFVTAFLGVLDLNEHHIDYHSGGQGPLLHFHAETGECEWRESSTMPMGFLDGIPLTPPPKFQLAPGDILGLITDGLFEYENVAEEMFGRERVGELIRQNQNEPMERLIRVLFEAVEEFGGPVPQADDITMVFVRRLP